MPPRGQRKPDEKTTSAGPAPKRRRLHSPPTPLTNAQLGLNPQLNPFANGHTFLHSGITDMAKLFVMDIVNYYERVQTCHLCREPIEGIPFTLWTCGTCYLCETCVCNIYDKHRYKWSAKNKKMKYHMLGQLETSIWPNLKCFICRTSDTNTPACHTISPTPCDMSRFMIGKTFMTELKTGPKVPSDLTMAHLETFQTLYTNIKSTKMVYTCPHCKILTFTHSQLNRYMRHQIVCTYRNMQCVFSDCPVRNAFISTHLYLNSTDSYKDMLETTVGDFELDYHFSRDCKHRVACNLIDCKQHEENKTRIVFLCDTNKHLSALFHSLAPLNDSKITNTFRMWSESEMEQKFPNDMKQCPNPNYDTDDLSQQAITLQYEDDDNDGTPSSERELVGQFIQTIIRNNS
jgi:hypothetical protein